MHFHAALRRFALFVWLFAAWIAGLSGCGEAPASPDASALHDAFPAEAAPILQARRAFVATAEGFGVRPQDEAGEDAPRALLPRRGDGAVHFALGGGAEARVREVGATGEGRLAEHAVRYARRGGTSYWAAAEGGYEEWLLLSPSAVRRDAAVAAWEVEGAALRQAGDAVDLVDGSGAARMRVTAPSAYAAGGRAVGVRLAAQGSSITAWVDAEGEPLLVDPGWTFAGSMITARYYYTTTVLQNGLVLIVGGQGSEGTLRSAEVYDPRDGTFTATGLMSTARSGHTATLLQDGRVLVAGGKGDQGALDSAEIYDPKTNNFTLAATMSTARHDHTATPLLNPLTQTLSSQVLIAGGGDAASPLASAEIYDLDTGTFAPAGSMVTARTQHTATALRGGKVLLLGGEDGVGNALAAAELYDPLTTSFATTGMMSTARYAHTATLLPATALHHDRVLVVGGEDDSLNPLDSVEIYDYDPQSETGTFVSTLAEPMHAPRYAHTATALADGRVLVAGGTTFNGPASTGAEIYDPTTNGFKIVGAMSTARTYHAATALQDGRVLVAGGEDKPSDPLAGAELYDPKIDSFVPAGQMIQARYDHVAMSLLDGRVLVAGGTLDKVPLATAELYDPNAGAFASVGPMSIARTSFAAAALPGGLVLVTGGRGPGMPGEGDQGNLASADVYEPEGQKFSPTGSMNVARVSHTATALADGRVLVVGGQGDQGLLASAEIYAGGFVMTTGSLTVARDAHTTTLLADGRVLVAGGYDGIHALDSAEIYDPATDGFTPTQGPMNIARTGHTATLLPSGKVLVVGGESDLSTTPAPAELYDPTTGLFTLTVGPASTARRGHTATRFPDGRVVVAGGEGAAGPLAGAEVYDPTTDAFTSMGSMDAARTGHAAALLPSGRVLVTGGQTGAETALATTSASELFQLQPQGAECAASAECQSDACVDGVCCDSPCNTAGTCNACSRAGGATADGVCTVRRICTPFACDPSTATSAYPACQTPCTAPAGCADGYACVVASSGATATCVPIPLTSSSVDYGGCSLDGAPRGRAAPGLALLAALAALRRRGRRAARAPAPRP